MGAGAARVIAVRWPGGRRVHIIVNDLVTIVELGPNDASLFAQWLLGGDG